MRSGFRKQVDTSEIAPGEIAVGALWGIKFDLPHTEHINVRAEHTSKGTCCFHRLHLQVMRETAFV